MRLAAEREDEEAQQRLDRGLARLRERAEAGNELAREFLAENPDWRQYLAEQTGRDLDLCRISAQAFKGAPSARRAVRP